MKVIAYRSSMPFDNRGDSGNPSISPTTQKSIQPFNNVLTIQDLMSGEKTIGDFYPNGGGDWSSGEDVDKSYREKGDEYKRSERDWDILNNLLDGGERSHQQWKVKVPGGNRVFMSFELAQQYIREKKLPYSYVTRIAQKNVPQNNTSVVSDSINKCVMIQSIDAVESLQETGSAFCVFLNHFITCAHVIKKYNKNDNVDPSFFVGAMVSVVQAGRKYKATVMSVDPKRDLALIKCDDINTGVFELAKDYIVGEDIVAIGSPRGFENNVSAGILGSLNRKLFFYDGAPDYMFVDLAVFPGSSGCPIIRSSTGEVIGMVTLIVAEEGEYGLNAALPSNHIIDFCNKNIEGFSNVK